MIDELDALGCRTPVLPGIMPVINVAGVKRMAAMNGTVIPPHAPRTAGSSRGRRRDVVDIGVESATALCEQMLELGAPGLHLYALNRPTSVRRIYDNLGLAPTS